MKIYRHKTLGKLFLLLFAIFIGMGSLIFTSNLVRRLKAEERKNVELWAEAIGSVSVADTNQNLDFLFSIIDNNNTIPVILTDESDSIISAINFDEQKIHDNSYMIKRLNKIKEKNDPIINDLGNNHYNLIYYRESNILTMLIYYPYVQLGIIILFIMVSYLAFSSSQKSEENQVWAGMSKETAHQLGTPTSSLAGWIEIMQHKYPDISISGELAHDVKRLEKVTERFSGIGSKPTLSHENIIPVITSTIDYLRKRTSSKVRFVTEHITGKNIIAPVNSTLFEWVIENISKNAIDSMEGKGIITYLVSETEKHVIIDISDTGKGIPKSYFKKIFNPGFTTKQRGWGLGLSLARRIIEEYHNGRIFVRSSEIGIGSSLRIIIRKDAPEADHK
jgi:nitrogen-specific signal transduction histidine kinase